MKRLAITPRPDWQERLEKIGFYYHSIDGNYWQENACYAFNLAQIDILEDATQTLHQLYLQAASQIVQKGDYARLGLDEKAAYLIEQSWRRQAPCLYGRFDLCYDGTGNPKLLEYNADTPTALFEASVAQWYWLKEQQPQILPAHADQFNSIHERLVIEWKNLAQHWQQKKPLGIDSDVSLHFVAISDSLEDLTTCRYLQDTAIQAGLTTQFLDIRGLGWDNERHWFVDENNDRIHQLFKLYPWEWLLHEPFAQYLPQSYTHWLEPAWKLLLSNKAMLAILWEMFPNHPNLLPAYFESNKHRLANRYVKKPFFSREGANVTLINGDTSLDTTGDYGQEGFVYQACQPLPCFTNQLGQPMYAVIGSWIIGHHAAGIGIREDYSLITKDTSLFVPHIFLD